MSPGSVTYENANLIHTESLCSVSVRLQIFLILFFFPTEKNHILRDDIAPEIRLKILIQSEYESSAIGEFGNFQVHFISSCIDR